MLASPLERAAGPVPFLASHDVAQPLLAV